MQKLSIAVAGAGLIGRTHIALVQTSPDCVLSAIVDPAPAASEIALAAGVPLYRSLGELFARAPQEGVRLCDAADRARAKILVGHHRVHSPLLATARSIVQSGRLGRIVAVVGSAMFYKPDGYFDEAPWRRQAGGGPILINLIHESDCFRSHTVIIRAV